MFEKIACATVLLTAVSAVSGQWKPAGDKLMTRWAKDVSPETAHREYPRPQMVRGDWANLNGLWDYAIRPVKADKPAEFDGKILVPFAVESALSGVGKRVGASKRLWYRRTFEVPATWAGRRVLMHFGAVDWDARVSVNGKAVGSHKGGYDAFAFDVTDALKPGGRQEVVVSVFDPTKAGSQPRGKQVDEPKGIWYTPVTGIWQTVWLEPVTSESIEGMTLVPDIDRGVVSVTVRQRGKRAGCTVEVVAYEGKGQGAKATGPTGTPFELKLSGVRLWSPDSPFLYGLSVTLLREGKPVDGVQSYFGMRKIALGKDASGITRIMFNNKPLFQYGPLDQGWWPDGLYTAPSDEALYHDLAVTKKLGFNMVRKHVKVEPARWYHHCDKLGLIVWQDMPSGDKHAPWPRDGQEITRTEESSEQFGRELEALVRTHINCPSIAVWVPFNEAWGQFKTAHWAKVVKDLDPSRLVIAASGGNDFAAGDIRDIHDYPGPDQPPAVAARAAVLGEFGGLGLALKGHLWQEDENWGYRSYKDKAALAKAYERLMVKLRPMIESRLSAAVYTQTTDVEVEVNGLMTYDRAVTKFDIARMVALHRKLYAPLPKQTPADMTHVHTVAYWRFEEGKVGQLVPHAPAPKVKGRARGVNPGYAARDESGHKNHLYAANRNVAPKTAAHEPARTAPLTGLPNKRCLDDTAAPAREGGTRDLFTSPGRSRTHMNAINGFQFTQWTVEASFNVADVDRFHGLVGKDGKPTDQPHAPLQLKVRGGEDKCIQIEAIDSTGTRREVRSTFKVVAGRWYHAAATSDGKTLSLYVDSGEGKGYVLQGRTDFTGQLINTYGTWTVGRGFHGGKMTDDARALIDEIRISAAALRPDQFLHAAAQSEAVKPKKTD